VLIAVDAILHSECDGTRWCMLGEVKGKLATGVGSQYSYTTSQCSVSNITTADAHTSAASSRLNWLPRWFKWTRPFRQKTKCGFCAYAIRLHMSSTNRFSSLLKSIINRWTSASWEVRCWEPKQLTSAAVHRVKLSYVTGFCFYYKQKCLWHFLIPVMWCDIADGVEFF
jgi:hypothetical protein